MNLGEVRQKGISSSKYLFRLIPYRIPHFPKNCQYLPAALRFLPRSNDAAIHEAIIAFKTVEGNAGMDADHFEASLLNQRYDGLLVVELDRVVKVSYQAGALTDNQFSGMDPVVSYLPLAADHRVRSDFMPGIGIE
jgi:hypothetical protein